MKTTAIFTALLLTANALTLNAQECTQSYKDTSLTPEERAADLLKQLTLEEKASLVVNSSKGIDRLGIKAYNWWNEALHGVARNGSATVFPQAIGMASSFDTVMIERVFSAISDEARIKNAMALKSNMVKQYQGLTFWTPNINIFRDPRWGRGMETYGEDPYLTGQLGMAVVRGLQGDPNAPVLKTHACAKHYAVHSGLESNRHSFDAQVSERDLRETYLPAFKDLVTKAKVKEVMTAYNRFRGVPCAASEYLVRDILRGEWGYEGLVVSDCWAIPDFFEEGHHGYTENETKAAAVAVSNGLDVECGSSFAKIPDAVREGLLDEKDLDRNLMRVLTERFRLGEMDGVSPWDDLDPALVEGKEHKAMSLEMAHESMVLLKNNGILPLKPGSKIALVGPNADDAEMLWGNYNPVPQETVTLLQALKKRNQDLIYTRGCGIVDSKYTPGPNPRTAAFLNLTEEQMKEIAQKYAIGIEDIKMYIKRDEQMKASFLPELNEEDVIGQLKGVDIVIFAGGISPRLEGEEMPVKVPGFDGGDRTDIELPDVQRRLIKALKAAGKKIVLVNFSGAAMGLVPETENCDAILQAWYPGQEGGTAIADILYGDVVPSGKLPVTFYKNADQLPEVEDYNLAGHTYRYFKGEPLYPFGYGLSYTTFAYSKPKVKNGEITVDVKSKSKKECTEVVQLYVRKKGDDNGPLKTLRAFKRVLVPANGKAVSVSFPLTSETFTWWSEEKQNMVPMHGEYELYIGSSSDSKDLQKVDYKY